MAKEESDAAAAAADKKSKKKKKKEKTPPVPLTPVERLQELSLLNKATELLKGPLKGLEDKTLTEFLVTLVTTELQTRLKQAAKTHSSLALNTQSTLEAAHAVQQQVAEATAGTTELPLGVCQTLVEWVASDAPQYQRLLKKKLDQREAASTKQQQQQQAVASNSSKYLSKADLATSTKKNAFPGLAKANLDHAVPLPDPEFYEHTPEDHNNKKRANAEYYEQLNQMNKRQKPNTTTSHGGGGASMEQYSIHRGTIMKIMDHGVSVQLTDLPQQQQQHPPLSEGMVFTQHVSTQRIQHPSDAKNMTNLRRGADCWVKILSVHPKLLLSFKDVDQKTGRDLMPHRSSVAALEVEAAHAHNNNNNNNAQQQPDHHHNAGHPGLDVAALKKREAEAEANRIMSEQMMRSTTTGGRGGDDDKYSYYGNASHHAPQAAQAAQAAAAAGPMKRRKQHLSEHELYEATQLIRSGVLPVEEYPTFDAEAGGMLAIEETEEETEVELAEREPAFLKGQTRRSGRHDLEPVKIVKNPDGSLSRAAMQQVNMAKERRELKQAQANQLIDSIPKDLNRPWEDPLPEAGERHFAQELRSINMSTFETGEAPQWKQKAENKTLSYGIISNKSLQEQRADLPIAKLKTELMNAISTNQVLVVIGETGVR